MPHGLAPFVGAVREASYSSDPEHCRAHPLVGFKQRLHTAPALLLFQVRPTKPRLTLCTMDVTSRSRLEQRRGLRSDECIFLKHTGQLKPAVRRRRERNTRHNRAGLSAEGGRKEARKRQALAIGGGENRKNLARFSASR